MAAYAPYKYNPAEISLEDMAATFVGRHHLLDRLVEAVQEQSETDTIQHYLLLGPRGIGKTTLLLMLRQQIKNTPDLASRWICVQYREEEFYVYTLRDLLALALENLAAEENIPEASARLAEAENEPDDDKSLAIILDGLKSISETHQKRIVLLIDNFDLIFPQRTASEADRRAFRKLLNTSSYLMVVGSSVRQFEDIAAYDEAFFNFFSPVPVENLTDDDIQTLLLTRAKHDDNTDFLQNYEQHKEKIRAITFLTGGNPRLVMMLYEILSRKHIQHVVDALRETIDNLTPLLKDVLEDLPPQQSKILDALMRAGGVSAPKELATRTRLPLNAVTTQLGRLKETRLVEVQGKSRAARYQIRDQMFKTWYQMRYLRPARRRVEIFVEFLRAWFSAEDRLAELQKLNQQVQKAAADGLQNRVRESAVAMDYFTASLDTIPQNQKRKLVENVAEAYVQAGELREAALNLAEIEVPDERSQTRIETIGYKALGDLLVDKGNLSQATKTYQEALQREPYNIEAMIGLGLCAGLSNKLQEALQIFSEIIALDKAPVEQLAKALYSRGVIKHQLNDFEGAIEDYTTLINLENAPVDEIAGALYNRGVTKGQLNDFEGAIEDYTTLINLENAPVEQIAEALFNRGVTKGQLNDFKGAIEDYTTLINLENAPVEQIAKALYNRGVTYGNQGNHKDALKNFDTAVNLDDISNQNRLSTLLLRGIAHENLDKINNALADYTQCANSEEQQNTVHGGLSRLIRLYSKIKRTAEAKAWVARIEELEPDKTSMEQKLEMRIDLITEIAQSASIDIAVEFLDTLLESSSDDLRDKLHFLKPGLAFAQTGDEAVLVDLPEEEGAIARRIAATLTGGEQK